MEIIFSKKSPEQVISEKKRSILFFFNLHNVWWIRNSKKYFDITQKDETSIFPDGKIISRILRISQERGINFTQRFLKSPEARNKRHLIIGIEENEVSKMSLVTSIPQKNIFPYHSQYTKDKKVIILPEIEVKKISTLANKKRVDYIWIGTGSPKQEFTANQLFDKTNAKSLICIGAGKDFLLGKKKEAPKFFIDIGAEWLYRLMTDFNLSKKKVWRSFSAFFYIISRRVNISAN